MIRRLLLVSAVALVAGCATVSPRERSDEQRIDDALTATHEPVPEGLAFEKQTAGTVAEDDEFVRENEVDRPYIARGHRLHRHSGYIGGGYRLGNGFGTPTVRSNALTHPSGLPGGSTPGLLP